MRLVMLRMRRDGEVERERAFERHVQALVEERRLEMVQQGKVDASRLADLYAAIEEAEREED